MKLRLGTRGSDLATTQSNWVAAELAKCGIETEIVIISTSGDRSNAPSFGAIGPQGVFVREIEQALLAREIDLAVHSFKDLPTQSPAGLVIAAVPPRRDPADWLLYRPDPKRGLTPISENWGQTPFSRNWGQTPFSGGKRGLTLPLPPGARVGTASARRQAWLRLFGPELAVASLRGNVPTRLKRLGDGDFDGIVLAGAGIERLTEASDLLDDGLAGVERLRLDPLRFVPAPAQGALAVQCRADDDGIRDGLANIDDAATRTAIDVERHALALAEGGCDSAFGAYARGTNGNFELSIMTERDGQILAADVEGKPVEALAEQALANLVAVTGATS
jgi:hydroxymethylbilane synthase